MYHVFLNNVEIGTTALESGDPPMGFVVGKVTFLPSISPFRLLCDHCRSQGISITDLDPEFKAIGETTIPELHVYRADGAEVVGQGCSISGFGDEGYYVTIAFIPYPFYGEEFSHHCQAYNERFKAVTMHSVTRKHLSVVDGRAQFAQVTVAESVSVAGSSPILILNDREIGRRTEADEALVAAAVRGLRETEARLSWRGLPLHVTKVESSYVDMHPEAAYKAAVSAAASLIEGEI